MARQLIATRALSHIVRNQSRRSKVERTLDLEVNWRRNLGGAEIATGFRGAVSVLIVGDCRRAYQQRIRVPQVRVIGEEVNNLA